MSTAFLGRFRRAGALACSGLRRAAAFACICLSTNSVAAQAVWRLEPELRIGRVDGPGSLTAIGSVQVSRDGRLIVASQPRESAIRFFDAESGALVRTIGRRGRGPGEFQLVVHLSWKGDSIAAFDAVLRTLTLFSPDGRYIRSVNITTPVMPQTRLPAHATRHAPGGLYWGESMVNSITVANGKVKLSPIVLMSEQGEVKRVVGERSVAGTIGVGALGAGVAVFRQPYAERDFRSFAPEGGSVVLLSAPEGTENFEVVRVDGSGAQVYRRSYRYKPREMTRKMRDHIYETFRRTRGGSANAEQMEKAARALVRMPGHLPPVTAILHDWDRRVWLRREQLSETVEWLVLDADGHLVASLKLPATIKLHAARGWFVWGELQDELGVPYLQRYRIIPG